MVSLNKEMNRNQKRKSRNKLQLKLTQILIGYPVYFIFIKPYIISKKSFHNLIRRHYSKRFKTVEWKALEEMKRYLAKELSTQFKQCVIFEEFNYEQETDLCVKKFLQSESIYYRRANRKYSKLYGELFTKEIENNHLNYMNELVIWLLDQGCEVRTASVWSEYGRKMSYLLATTK